MTRSRAKQLLDKAARRLRGRDTREPGLVNHISLGSHCHMAQILKATGLRTWSGPFDWIFTSPGMVLDCLSDDFAALLDRAHYESTPLEARPAPHEWSCRHRLYHERHAIPYVFNHHDPATSEADYGFLREGVRRLRGALAERGARNRFYILTSLPVSDDTALGLCDALSRRGEDNRLILMQNLPDAEAASVEPMPAARSNLTWLRVATRSASVGVRFTDPTDDAMVRALVCELARG